ncbi:hypothetical protein ABU614_05055 [Lysobacter firmicutimachus]|uniref:Uncharacterized protein n=1 Tax=Lysobacter firmicutimachus TaxID=1792846 RepID=A0AAU8MWR6_9GAMM
MSTIRIALSGAVYGLAILASPATANERVPATIDWPQAQSDIRADEKLEPDTVRLLRSAPPLQRTLDRIALPVLIPEQEDMAAAPALLEQGSAYAADYALDGADLVVLGSASAIAVDAGAPLSKLLGTGGEPYRFESYEYGADLSFVRYGASYVLRLSCDAIDDSRCRDDDFLRAIAGDLVAVGGQP